MKLFLENNILYIRNFERLKKYQLFQIEYFGFVQDKLGFQKSTNDPYFEFKRIQSFCEAEGIAFEMDSELRKLAIQSNETQLLFKESFEKAKRIKDGDLGSKDFFSFELFVKSLPRELKPHQIKAAYHFYSLKNGANFSVPGSGKTSVILTVYEKLRKEGKCNMLFIIGPPSCFQPWKNEFAETLGRKADSTILSGRNKKDRTSEYYKPKEIASELYLSTFHTALNDYENIIHFLNQTGINAFVIIDEAHYIKQIGGAWATSILKIGKYAAFKGVLTGTPIPKAYKDVYNLFDFLWTETPLISLDEKIQIDQWEKNKNDLKVKKFLHEKIGALFYRVRKKDLELLKPIFHKPIIVKMESNEQKIYVYVKSKIFDLDQHDYFNNENVLKELWKGRIMRLRQAVSYPRLLLSAIDNYKERIIDDSELRITIRDYDTLEVPGKLKILTKMVLDLRSKNQKILIWSNFIGTLELIKSHLVSLNQRCEIIYGKTPIRNEDSVELKDEKTREDIRDEFVNENSGLDILIANPAACAESISLHKTCFHAIYYDLSYNCAQYIQSLDRIHRVGGSEKNIANYYFLQYENSLDQDIKSNLEKKAKKMYNIIEKDYVIYDLDLNEENSDDDVLAYKRLFKKTIINGSSSD